MDWKTEVYGFGDGYCDDIKLDYKILLGLKLSDEEAEEKAMKYSSRFFESETVEEGRAWGAIALTQWKYGRLTPSAKENALRWLKVDGVFSKNTAQKLEDTLLSPMKKKRNFSIPPWARNTCPWPEGTLLAYHLTSASNEENQPFWGKYALLRIVDLEFTPYTILAPELGGFKRMRIAVYNWCGSRIPDPNIVSHLEYMPLEENASLMTSEQFERFLSMLPGDMLGVLDKTVTPLRTAKPRYTTVVDNDDLGKLYTYLDCDPDFKKHTPEEIGGERYGVYSGAPALDCVLMNRFKKLSDAGRLKYDD